MSKERAILTHLQSGQPLNKYSAYRLFGAQNLSSLVGRLKGNGVDVKDRLCKAKNAMGVETICFEYYIHASQ
jgi:hypothetical protein